MSQPLTIDWSGNHPRTPALADAIATSCENFGGVFIKGAPLLHRHISDLVEAQKKIFALPLEIKERYRPADGPALTGYVGYGLERAGYGVKPDPKEVWHVARDGRWGDPWPVEVPEFKTSVLQLQPTLEKFASEFMLFLGETLGCRSYAGTLIERSDSILRMVRYDLTPKEAGDESIAGEHRDIGLFTIHLHQSHAGYQSLGPSGWRDHEARGDMVFITPGEMLSHVSNGYFRAPLHRVRRPHVSEEFRHYTGYFVHPNPKTLLRCYPQAGQTPLHPDILSQDLIARRLAEMTRPVVQA